MIIVVTFISIRKVWELLFHKIPLKIQEFNLCKNHFNHHALCQLLFYFFSPVLLLLLIYCTFEKISETLICQQKEYFKIRHFQKHSDLQE